MSVVEPVFSDYVRSLEPSGEPPDRRDFDRVWRTLGRALKSELRKRGLWETPPSYLGIHGSQSWHEPATPPGPEWFGGALEELLAECYTHIFIRRLGGLKSQLEVKPNIEGLVFLCIRNFLHDTQKRHDPLGFRLFELLHAAVRGGLASGELLHRGGDRRVRNDTLLGFSQPSEAVLAPRVDADSVFGETVKLWNDTLLPDLVTARGEGRKRVIAILQSLLLRLPAAGIERFTFKQLIDPLKDDARARWKALSGSPDEAFELSEEGTPVLVQWIGPDTQIEDRDQFEKLVACVTELLHGSREQAGTRHYESTLWEFLRTRSAGLAADRGDDSMGGALPSARKLSQLLRIPRERLPGLFATLGAWVEECRAAISSGPPVNSSHEVEEQ